MDCKILADIWSLVLRFMPTKELINTCRLISKQFYVEATHLCRLRYVTTYKFPIYEEIVNGRGLRNLENLPASSTFVDYDPRLNPISDSFLSYFIPNIWQLELTNHIKLDSYNELSKILSSATKLRRLCFEALNGVHEFDSKSWEGVHLKDLNEIKINANGSGNSNFFIGFIRSVAATRMKLLELSNISLESSESVKSWASLMSLFQKVHISLSDCGINAKNVFDTITSRNLNITVLFLSINVSDNNLSVYQELLGNLPLLTKITLNFDNIEKCKIPIQFPRLSQLIILKIHFQQNWWFVQQHERISILSHWDALAMPKLEKVVLRVSTNGHGNTLIKLLPPNLVSKTTTRLNIEGTFNYADWNHHFPNVLKLKVRDRQTCVGYILKTMLQVKVVYMTVFNETGVDIKCFPDYFTDLTGLKVNGEALSDERNSVLVRDFVLQLPKLNFLTLDNLTVSDADLRKLRQLHTYVWKVSKNRMC